MPSGGVKGDLLLRGAKFVLVPVDCGHLPSLHCASGTGGNLWAFKRRCTNYRHLLMLTYYGGRRARLPHFSAVEFATSFLFLMHTSPKRFSLRWLCLPTFLWTELLEEWRAYSSTAKPFMWCGRIRQFGLHAGNMNTESGTCTSKYNFNSVFLYTPCSMESADNNRTNVYEIQFTV